MNGRIKIAGVQMNPALMQTEANLTRILDFVGETSKSGANLTIFPECALTGYCFDSRAEAAGYAQTIPGPATERIADLCRTLDQHVIVGLPEKEGERLFNAAAFIGPAGLIGKYRKVHLPGLGLDHFVDPGDLGFRVYDTRLGRIGINICYDGMFPESSRVMALKQADLIVLPTNWPTGAEEFADYIINARSLENHIFYAAIDRVGEERGFRFIGRSRITHVLGRTLAQGSPDREEILYAEIEPSLARNKRIVRVPGKHEIHRFNDRRPECYGEVVQPKTKMDEKSVPSTAGLSSPK